MRSWVRQLLSGERRRQPRYNPEKLQVVNRQAVVAETLARRLGTTPDELYDYRVADRILGRHQ